ncbi:MAG: molybdopterin-dependent oxidoreductase [Pseudomonadota bacterium]|nr:molybdopterin-dependent oxidoreductase [Pseudomonadota bacterium]
MRRRAFVAAGAATLTVTLLPGCALVPVIPKRPAPSLSDAAGWVRHASGRYTVHLPRAEMGQNIATAFKQIACDELGAAWDSVEVQLMATTTIARVKATVGSDSVKDYALPLAQACATLRLALEAGSRDAVLQAQDLPPTALRAFSRNATWVGRAAPQVQGREIVTGQPLYAADIRRPGMLFGRVLRAPASPETPSRPGHFNEAAGHAVPGFVAVVTDKRLAQSNAQGLGIVAHTPGALDRIEAALAVDWLIDPVADTRSPALQIDLAPRLERGQLAHVARKGQLEEAAPWTVDMQLEVPLAAHSAIEPRAAVAEPRGKQMALWVGGQDPFYQRDVVARALGLNVDDVHVQAMRIGGAFGGKTLCTVELEAAVLAHTLRAPVKVQWTRKQELAQAFHRPPSSHRVRARLRDGKLTDWWHAFSTSHILFTGAAMPPWMQLAADFLGDAGVARGSTLPYDCTNQRVEYDLTRLTALTGPWRGLGAAPNLLAVESAIDECARASGMDALAFRLKHLSQPRLKAVLERVARDARWGSPLLRQENHLLRGRGLACGIYKGMSYAAAVADVEIDSRTGAARVARLWCAHDCGRMINPDQVRAQTEGNLVWCIGMMLVEELPFANGRVQASSFADAPIPRIADIGAMEITLIDSPEPSTGAGETAMVAGAGAIANALRDAAGHRFNRVPVRASDILQALRR